MRVNSYNIGCARRYAETSTVISYGYFFNGQLFPWPNHYFNVFFFILLFSMVQRSPLRVP